MAGHSRLKDGVAYASLCRPSTSFVRLNFLGVDARNKSGHDGGEVRAEVGARYAPLNRLPISSTT